MIFNTIVKYGEANNKFLKYSSGSNVRYPHLNLRLRYNPEVDMYTSVDVENNAEEFLGKDLVVRELMIPSLRRLFIKNMLGMECSDKEKLLALDDLTRWKIPSYEIKTVIPRGFGWRKKVPLHLVQVKSDQIFPIGMMAKGTDIAIIDQHDSTYGQEAAHSIYHYKEGLTKGIENITEVHGDPFYVYALQCRDGRMARRIRHTQSPHRIKFPDYVCLRAWAGTKIKEGTYHGALGLLAPPMNLVANLVDEKVLVDALFEGSSKAIEDSVDEYLGPGAYEEIYTSYDVFERFGKIIRRRNSKEVLELMFHNPLFKSQLSQDEIRKIWENPCLRNERLVDRLEEVQ